VLGDLWVFGRNSLATWQSIFLSCAAFIDECKRIEKPAQDSMATPTHQELYEQKTIERLQDFCNTHELNMDSAWQLNGQAVASLNAIIQECLSLIPDASPYQHWVHGDFCASNILYDSRSLMIKVIDPRGLTPNQALSPYGDLRYDIAKLAHSFNGCYDQIIAGFFECSQPEDYHLSLSIFLTEQQRRVQKLFQEQQFHGYTPGDPCIQAIVILLFLSMLPLHADKPARQWAFLANALRLYQELRQSRLVTMRATATSV
jgi:Phosphotransferase enzyme family